MKDLVMGYLSAAGGHLCAASRSHDEPALVQVELADLIKPQTFQEVRIAAGQAEIEMPPLSLTAIRFRLG